MEEVFRPKGHFEINWPLLNKKISKFCNSFAASKPLKFRDVGIFIFTKICLLFSTLQKPVLSEKIFIDWTIRNTLKFEDLKIMKAIDTCGPFLMKWDNCFYYSLVHLTKSAFDRVAIFFLTGTMLKSTRPKAFTKAKGLYYESKSSWSGVHVSVAHVSLFQLSRRIYHHMPTTNPEFWIYQFYSRFFQGCKLSFFK